MSEVDLDALRREVDSIAWYHRIDLGHGIVTPGMYDPGAVLDRIGIPERLDGRSVLDIGAYDGFFSFEAERRGAARVLATDSYEWTGAGTGSKRGFELARRALGSSVEDMDIDVMDLTPQRVGTFDLVLFLGVLYHLRDPITAIERVASVATDQVIIDTVVSLMWMPVPAARLFPNDELGLESSNWWALNTRAVSGLLRSHGFRKVQVHSRHPRRELVRTAIGKRRRREWGILQTLASQRATFHAWR